MKAAKLRKGYFGRKLRSPAAGRMHRGNAGAEKPAPAAEKDFGSGAMIKGISGNGETPMSWERAEGEIAGDAGCKLEPIDGSEALRQMLSPLPGINARGMTESGLFAARASYFQLQAGWFGFEFPEE